MIQYFIKKGQFLHEFTYFPENSFQTKSLSNLVCNLNNVLLLTRRNGMLSPHLFFGVTSVKQNQFVGILMYVN